MASKDCLEWLRYASMDIDAAQLLYSQQQNPRQWPLVEELGSGMKRIIEAYDRSVFEITPSFVVVTFPYASDFERDLIGENDAVGVNGANLGANGVNIVLELKSENVIE